MAVDDIEDLVGQGKSAPIGFHLPAPPSQVGMGTRGRSEGANKPAEKQSPTSVIPGTQSIFLKTFGCAHNTVSVRFAHHKTNLVLRGCGT